MVIFKLYFASEGWDITIYLKPSFQGKFYWFSWQVFFIYTKGRTCFCVFSFAKTHEPFSNRTFSGIRLWFPVWNTCCLESGYLLVCCIPHLHHRTSSPSAWFFTGSTVRIAYLNWCIVDKPVVSVCVEPVPCSRVSMDLFDPLYTCGILRPSGLVVKCFHELYPDYNKLRKVTPSPVCAMQKKSHLMMARFLSADVKGRRFRWILCGWTWRQSRVSLLPLQTPLSRRRALPIRGLRQSLHKNHKANIQRTDQVKNIKKILILFSTPKCNPN